MTIDATLKSAGRQSRRSDLADRHLRAIAAVALALIALFFALKPWLPAAWQRPGTPLLQTFAIAGALLLLVPFAYVLVKRGGMSAVPNRWLIAHVIAAFAGTVLTVVHSGGVLTSPPSTMLAALAGLVLTGGYARLSIARDMASTLGTKRAAFAVPDAQLRAHLQTLIERKTDLLARLDTSAREATFSVGLRHWLRHPLLAWRYAQLAREEAGLIGARGSVGTVQAWWRPVHLALAVLFLAALVVHVVAVTFFAGYVAAGRPVTWWHVTAW